VEFLSPVASVYPLVNSDVSSLYNNEFLPRKYLSELISKKVLQA
jgi:hypothetical protein